MRLLFPQFCLPEDESFCFFLLEGHGIAYFAGAVIGILISFTKGVESVRAALSLVMALPAAAWYMHYCLQGFAYHMYLDPLLFLVPAAIIFGDTIPVVYCDIR